MSVIRADGPATEKTPNIIKPGDKPVELSEVKSAGPIIIKPTAIPYPPPKPRALTPIRKDAINFPGDDNERDFVMKPTMEDLLKILQANANAKQRAYERTLQPLPPARIYDPDEEEPWPYAIKLGPRAPRPNLKFNPETYTYIPNHVKNRRPYQINPETKTNWAPPTNPPRHITVKPNSKIIPTPPDLYTNQPPNHVIIKPPYP